MTTLMDYNNSDTRLCANLVLINHREKGSIQTAGWNKASRNDMDEYTQRFEVKKIIIHPLFTKRCESSYSTRL